MATYRLLHVTRTGGDTDGLAEFTNSDTVLLPVHSSDPTGTTEGEMIYNSTDDKIKIYDGSAWVVVGNTSEQIQDIVGAMFTGNTETGITATYEDSDGTIDLVVSADSALIKDTDNDTKIQVEESSDEYVENLAIKKLKAKYGYETNWKECVGIVYTGDTYSESENKFITPKIFDSWVIDEDGIPQAPTSYPDDGEMYDWNEETEQWDLIE